MCDACIRAPKIWWLWGKRLTAYICTITGWLQSLLDRCTLNLYLSTTGEQLQVLHLPGACKMESRTWQAFGLFPSSPPQWFFFFFFSVMYFIFLCVLLYIAHVEEINYVMLRCMHLKWSRGISWKLEILILSYRLKEVTISYLYIVFECQRIVHISAIRSLDWEGVWIKMFHFKWTKLFILTIKIDCCQHLTHSPWYVTYLQVKWTRSYIQFPNYSSDMVFHLHVLISALQVHQDTNDMVKSIMAHCTPVLFG